MMIEKMIDPYSEQADRIVAEVVKKVREELGLVGVSIDDMSSEDFRRYYFAVTSRIENAGIDFSDVMRVGTKRMAKALRESPDDVSAEKSERMKQFEDMVRRHEQ